MYIDADLAAEEAAALRALEVALQAAAVREGRSNRRAPSAAEQVLPDQRDVRRACSGVNRSTRIAWIIGSRL